MNVTHESDWIEHKGTQTSPPMRHLASVNSLVQQDTYLCPEPNSLLQGCHLPVQNPLGNSGQVLQTISPLAGMALHQLHLPHSSQRLSTGSGHKTIITRGPSQPWANPATPFIFSVLFFLRQSGLTDIHLSAMLVSLPYDHPSFTVHRAHSTTVLAQEAFPGDSKVT